MGPAKPRGRGARGVDHAQVSVGGHRRRFSPCDLSDWICRPNATPDLPLAVICFNEKTQTWRIGYLHEVAPDGSAVYVAGDLRVTVDAKGLVQPPSNRSAGVDCFGKTLKELRAEGRALKQAAIVHGYVGGILADSEVL